MSPLVGTVVIERTTLPLVCRTTVLALTVLSEAVGIANHLYYMAIEVTKHSKGALSRPGRIEQSLTIFFKCFKEDGPHYVGNLF